MPSCTSASSKSSMYRRKRPFRTSVYTVACTGCAAGILSAACSAWEWLRGLVHDSSSRAPFAGRVDCATKSCAYAHARSASNSSSRRLEVLRWYPISCSRSNSPSVFDHLDRQGRQFLELPSFSMGHFQRRSEAVCPIGAVFPISREIVVSKAIRAALLVCKVEGWMTWWVQRTKIYVIAYLGTRLCWMPCNLESKL